MYYSLYIPAVDGHTTTTFDSFFSCLLCWGWVVVSHPMLLWLALSSFFLLSFFS
jgi:hypothetical protein